MGNNESEHTERQFLPSFADLVDRLTVDQIKEALLSESGQAIADEIRKLENDIDLIIEDADVQTSARLLRKVIVLAQVNLQIWHNKDRMQVEPENYSDLLILAHQLNGIRNQIKNSLLENAADGDQAALRTNTETDGLPGWNLSL